MKSKFLLSTFLMAIALTYVHAATHTVSNSGTTFTPDELTITVGDVVEWDIGGSHNAVEVSEETWNANGSESNGGFNVDFGGGEVTFDEAGTYYYVCEPHAGLGMKGIIIVQTINSLADVKEEQFPLLQLYPNPARNDLTVAFELESASEIVVEVYDLSGRLLITAVEELFAAGDHTKTINLEALKPGEYIIYFKANDEVRIQKVSKTL